MSRTADPPPAVLGAFGFPEAATCDSTSGGFSDDRVWRVASPSAAAALRRSPPERADADRAAWTATVLRSAIESGAGFVAAPLATVNGGDGVATADGALWTASAWRTGDPLTGRSDHDAQRAAAEALASLHAALAKGGVRRDRSPAVAERRRRLADRPPETATAAASALGPIAVEFGELARRLRQPAVASLADHAADATAVSAVHGDARPEHFLTTAGRVTGVIDFGALRVDEPAADVARLAGELAASAPSDYESHVARVVDWYNRAADSPVRTERVVALDLAGTVVAAENWLRWTAEGRIARPRVEAVLRRLRRLGGTADP